MEERVNELEVALENYHLNGEVAKVLLDLSKARDLSTSLLLKQQVSINIPRVEDEVRKMKNQIVTLTQEDFRLSRELFDILGVPYMQAPSEAETHCAHLCVHGHASAVMSEDSDVLAYGTPAFLTKINTGQGVCEFIRYKDVLKELELTPAQFTDFCIMCGTDYNSNIFRIGPDKAYKLIKKHGSIEGVEKAGYDISILNHHRVRELFSVPEELEVHIPYCGRPDFEKLDEFLTVNNCKFDLKKLKKACEPIELIFEEEKES